MSERRRRAPRTRDDADDSSATAAPQAAPAAESSSLAAAFGAGANQGTRAWITLDSAAFGQGTIVFVLDQVNCPSAVTNFRFLCEAHAKPDEYAARQNFVGAATPLPPPLLHSSVTAVRKNEMFEFGTSPTASYWGGFFKDEWPAGRPSPANPAPATGRPDFTNGRVGTLSMMNVGVNTNASRFFVTLSDANAELDKDHLAFGRVVEGMDVVEALNNVKVDPKRACAPRERVSIVDCGVVDPLAAFRSATAATAGGNVGRDNVGARRGRDTDAVLSGSVDVAAVRTRADDAGDVADDRIHSTMAMSGALKRRRGEVADSRFAGALQATAIDSSVAVGGGMSTMPSARVAVAQQRRVFESNVAEIMAEQKYKKGAQRLRKQKDAQMAELAQQRRAKMKAKKQGGKVKYY